MTSSRSFELSLVEDGQRRFRWTPEFQDPPRHELATWVLSTTGHASLEFSTAPDAPHIEVLGGSTRLARLAPGTHRSIELDSMLVDLCGELDISVHAAVDPTRPPLMAVLRLPLRAPPDLEELYDLLARDLEAIHAGLASDVCGGVRHQNDRRRGRVFQPEDELEILSGHVRRIEALLTRIGTQPSTRIEREHTFVRWRPGDRVDTRSLQSIALDSGVTWRDDRPLDPGRAWIARGRLTMDIPEHRHIRQGLEQLDRRTCGLAAGCREAIQLLDDERRRWGAIPRDDAEPSVFEQKYGGRILILDRVLRSASTLLRQIRRTRDRHDFLQGVGRPRQGLWPTPLFRGRIEYRRVYEELRILQAADGPTLDGESLRLRLANLDVLYEYWCYIKTVGILGNLLGPPREGSGYRVHHDIYRPDLVPGQCFRWSVMGGEVLAWYEPDIPPVTWRDRGPLGLAASIVTAPLRPDVLVAIRGQGKPLRALVLDAKNTARFRRDLLFRISDYRTLIHEPSTGRQPIRTLFLLHRDRQTPVTESLPGYLDSDRERPADTSILGALCLLPGEQIMLERLLARFVR